MYTYIADLYEFCCNIAFILVSSLHVYGHLHVDLYYYVCYSCRSRSSLATTSRSAASGGSQKSTSSSRRGAANSGAGQTQAKSRRKRKKAAESAQTGAAGEREEGEGEGEGEGEQEQQPPPRKKRAYRRRVQVRSVDHSNNHGQGGAASVAAHNTTTAATTNTGAGAGHHDDMMQLTEQFAQQHYRNIVSQVEPTPPLQQLNGYTPTSLSFFGIPVFMGTSDADASSITTQVQLTSTLGQISLPPVSHVTRVSPTPITSPSLSMTSETQATSTMRDMYRLTGLQMPNYAYPVTTASSSAATVVATSSSPYSQYTFPSSFTAPTTSSYSLTTFPRAWISQPYPTQTSPTAPTMSSSWEFATGSTEASQSQDTSCGQSPSVSTRSQAPSDSDLVMFPKGPSFITVRHSDRVAFLDRQLNAVRSRGPPHANTAASSYIQPHASLLAPEFRQSASTATVRTSVCAPSSNSMTTSVTSVASGSSRTRRDSDFGVATCTAGSSAYESTLITNRLTRTFGETPYPSFGIPVPTSLAHVPSTSISFTSVTTSLSGLAGNYYHAYNNHIHDVIHIKSYIVCIVL